MEGSQAYDIREFGGKKLKKGHRLGWGLWELEGERDKARPFRRLQEGLRQPAKEMLWVGPGEE